MKKTFLTLWVTLTMISLYAERVDLTNPRASVINLFDNIDVDKRNFSTAAQSLYDIGGTQFEKEERARKLVQIFRGRGINIVYEDITIDSNYVNPITSALEVVIPLMV